MSTEIVNNREGILTVKITGHLSQAELLTTQKAAADILREHGGSRLLFVAEDFQGWERGADWDDFSAQFELDHYAKRIAIVGERRWKDLALLFAGKGLRRVDIEYFIPPDLEKARAWLSGG
ncbi:MAG TPA: STAS/SEC14 domain-containing protein [Verrucomicrobiae bacterium]|jgi:hypothetical protein|nr:STAS/SEC14 domain-containing protein [Verrucomicrobiae bacterium]